MTNKNTCTVCLKPFYTKEHLDSGCSVIRSSRARKSINKALRRVSVSDRRRPFDGPLAPLGTELPADRPAPRSGDMGTSQ